LTFSGNPIFFSDPNGDNPGGATKLSPFMEKVVAESLKKQAKVIALRTVSPGLFSRLLPGLSRLGGVVVLAFTADYAAGNMNGWLDPKRFQPLINPFPLPNLDPKQKPGDDKDGNKQTYIYETGRSVKSYFSDDLTSGTILPYFGITDNAFIAGIAIGRYSKEAEQVKYLPTFGGIIGKTDRVTAEGVESALIALNTYGKDFDIKMLSGQLQLSSRDVRETTRIDNLKLSTKSINQIMTGISWLRKHYGKDWQNQFYHPDLLGKPEESDKGSSPSPQDNTRSAKPPGG